MTHLRYRRASLVAAAAISAVLLAGCGGGTEGNGSQGLTGEPIKIMVTGPVNSEVASFPAINAAASVYADLANSRGGVDGRPLQVIECDNKYDPNATAECAREAVADGVVAVTGNVGPGADQLIAILANARIAWLPGASGSGSAVEFNAATSFPVNVGPYQVVGRALMAKKYGCTNVALFLADLPSLDQNVTLLQNALASEGLNQATLVRYPIEAPDLAPYVARLRDADCVLDAGNPEPIVAKFGPAIQQANLTLKRLVMSPTLTPTIVAQSPEAWNGRTSIVGYFTTPTPDNEWAEYLRAVDEYSTIDTKKNDFRASGSQGVWVAMSILDQVVTTLSTEKTELTAAHVLDALTTTKAASSGGVAPDLDLTQVVGVAGAPRLFNSSAGFASVEGGAVVPDPSGYHSILPTIEGQPNEDPFFASAS